MPELPEIETIKLQLQKVLVGQQITRIEKLHLKSVMGKIEKVTGKRVEGVDRKGKMLIIDFEGEMHVAIHFKMSGQLILIKNSIGQPSTSLRQEDLNKRIVGGHPTEDWVKPLPSKHTRAVFHFKSGDTMYFNDQRIFGWVKILSTKELTDLDFIKKLGKEPWDITDQDFYTLLTKRKKAIKVLLMDQNILSGVGNIYANDALWEAKIHPSTSAQSLSIEKAKLLRTGLIKVLKEGIKYGGATAADAKYIDLDGLGGHYQDHFRTYGREGEKCLRKDGGVIKKVVLGGRGTYFCPMCQK